MHVGIWWPRSRTYGSGSGVGGLRDPSGRSFVLPSDILKQSYDLLSPPRSLPSFPSDPPSNRGLRTAIGLGF